MDNGHLSIEEIEQIIQQKGPAEYQTHVESCQRCRSLLEKSRAFSAKLVKLASVHIEAGNAMKCPDERVWFDVAAGTLSETESVRYVQHAAECDSCAQKLKTATRMFAEELSPEEEQAVAALPSSSVQQQRKMVEDLARAANNAPAPAPVSPKPKRAFWKPLSFSLAGAAVVLAAVLVVIYTSRHDSPTDVEKLLAQAYTEDRIIAARFPKAEYGEMHELRGPGESPRFSQPATLLQAEEIISRHYPSRQQDVRWLYVRAQAEIMELQPESAIKTLERAADVSAQSTELMTNLAIAYFEEGEISHDPKNYAVALSFLNRILNDNPADLVALFNRALVYERLSALSNAATDWKRYLELDEQSRWAEEARNHYHQIEETIQSHDKGELEPLLEPRIFSVSAAVNWKNIDARIEDYLDQATSSWLPSVFAPYDTPGERERHNTARSATIYLGHLLKSNHGDLWLLDMLEGHKSADLEAGLRELNYAIDENARGRSVLALQAARKAAYYFKVAKVSPAILRARFEEVYALRRLARPCAASAGLLTADTNIDRYPWLGIQGLLEFASCEVLAGKIDQGNRDINRALRYAETRRYRSLWLRCVDFVSAMHATKGQFRQAWTTALVATGRFWTGPYRSIRGYILYSDLGLLAEGLNLWDAAYAMAFEATQLISKTGNRSAEAMARGRLADLAIMTGHLDDAQQNLQLADQIFSSLPVDDSIGIYRANGQLGLAEVDAEQGKITEPLNRLRAIAADINVISSYRVKQQYYFILGELLYRAGNSEAAENALLTSIKVGDHVRQSIVTERDKLTWDRQAGRSYRLLIEILMAQNRFQTAFDTWESYRNSLSKPVKQGNLVSLDPNKSTSIGAPPGEYFSQFLTQRETLISYAILSQGIAIWVLRGRELHGRWVTSHQDSFAHLVRLFVNECSDPISSLPDLKVDSRRLYDLLVKPIENQLRDSEAVIVEADGVIGAIPFQALLDSNGVYFGERLRIIYSPGFSYKPPDRPMENVFSIRNALVVGSTASNASFTNHFAPLDVSTELQTVASYFPHAVLLAGRRANSAAMIYYLPRISLFHFAGHAFSTPEGSGVVLSAASHSANRIHSESGILGAGDLENLKLGKCRVVVLSACSTGAIAQSGLADPDNLVRAFLRAGVLQVIATRWDITSDVSLTFIRSFYSTLRKTGSVGESVWQAARTIRKNPRTAHPYYWSAFSAFGTSDVQVQILD